MTPTPVRKAVGALRLSAGLYWSESLGLRAEKAASPSGPRRANNRAGGPKGGSRSDPPRQAQKCRPAKKAPAGAGALSETRGKSGLRRRDQPPADGGKSHKNQPKAQEGQGAKPASGTL